MAIALRAYAAPDRARVLAALDALQEHERALHDTRLPPGDSSIRYLDGLLARIGSGAGILMVAEADGQFAGFMACFVVEEDNVLETPDSNRFGLVSDIFVVPERRGTGIAQVLLAAAERHLAAQGVIRLRVNALAANRQAHRAYGRFGFAPYETMFEKRI